MEDQPDKDAARKMWCFWIAVGVVLLVFIIPISASISRSGSVEIRQEYTLWDKAVGNGPSEKADVYIDGKKVKRK